MDMVVSLMGPPQNKLITTTEVFEILCLQTLQDVGAMSGDGLCGPYNQQPKSKDWFPSSLSSADQDFCRTFRYVNLEFILELFHQLYLKIRS